MQLIEPVGILGFRRPQQTSREPSPDRTHTSSFLRIKGLSLINVMAAPSPCLLGLDVEIYWIPCKGSDCSVVTFDCCPAWVSRLARDLLVIGLAMA